MPVLVQRIAQVLLTACMAVLLLVSPAQASPNEDLQRARETFLAGDFEAAIAQFGALLYPTSRLAEASSIAEAHLALGVSYFETGNRENAGREFEEALFLENSLSLDETHFSPEVIRFFNARKAELKQRAADAAEKERLARKSQALSRAFQNLVVFERRRYWVNFIPLGAGQFQNDDSGKGRAFFVAGAVTGGTSLGLWSYQAIKYGFGGQVPRGEVNTVNTLQVLQIGSGALFFALWAWGIVDSLSNYEHAVKREADPSLIKDLEEIFENETMSGLRLVPNIGTESTGAALYWEF